MYYMYRCTACVGTSVQLNGLYGGGNDAKPPPLPAKKKHSAM